MISALLIGLLGSFHCVGMCGPLMITFTGKSTHPVKTFALYHSGRLMVYTFIGLLFGILSTSLWFFEFQQTGSIILGLLIVIVYAFPRWRNKVEGTYYHSRFYGFVKDKLTQYYKSKARWFAAGLLNGFLPCGMIYLAAAGAALAPSYTESVLFMVLFGAGTIPALMALSFVSKKLPQLVSKLSFIVTPMALVSGALLIFRGFTVQNPDFNQLIQAHIMNAVSACGL